MILFKECIRLYEQRRIGWWHCMKQWGYSELDIEQNGDAWTRVTLTAECLSNWRVDREILTARQNSSEPSCVLWWQDATSKSMVAFHLPLEHPLGWHSDVTSRQDTVDIARSFLDLSALGQYLMQVSSRFPVNLSESIDRWVHQSPGGSASVAMHDPLRSGVKVRGVK